MLSHDDRWEYTIQTYCRTFSQIFFKSMNLLSVSQADLSNLLQSCSLALLCTILCKPPFSLSHRLNWPYWNSPTTHGEPRSSSSNRWWTSRPHSCLLTVSPQRWWTSSPSGESRTSMSDVQTFLTSCSSFTSLCVAQRPSRGQCLLCVYWKRWPQRSICRVLITWLFLDVVFIKLL